MVKQAKDDFKNYLPYMSLCNLCSNKDDKNARIVFYTYPTILNAINYTKTDDGQRLFTPAHFDLIIIDESHRSIFKKYGAIFEYFDSILVGLTATPKDGVGKNTYDFFEVENKVPTYDYETAVYKYKKLVYRINWKLPKTNIKLKYSSYRSAFKIKVYWKIKKNEFTNLTDINVHELIKEIALIVTLNDFILNSIAI